VTEEYGTSMPNHGSGRSQRDLSEEFGTVYNTIDGQAFGVSEHRIVGDCEDAHLLSIGKASY